MEIIPKENYSEVICKYCGKRFLLLNSRIRRGNGKFCSKLCMGKYNNKKVKKICPTCGKVFWVYLYKIKEGKGKYCRTECLHIDKSVKVKCIVCGKEFWKTKKLIKSGRGKFCSKKCKHLSQVKREKVICEYCDKSFMAKAFEIKRGGGKYCSTLCANKDYYNKYGGSKASNWKGGKQRNKHNGEAKYKIWRTSVFKRDNYTCQECGQVGGKLNAHHILSWASYPDQRYILKNGITLCTKCHREKHRKEK